MIRDLKPYPAYRDSGVPWLGEVPEHWEVRRLKYLLREHDARSADGAEQLLRVSQYTGVTRRARSDGSHEPDSRAASLVGYKLVAPSELVVNIMLAWNGSMGVSRFPGIASPAYCVYRFGRRARPWYFHYLLRSPVYKARIKAVSTGVVESRLRLYTDDLYRLEALLPPVSEQVAIVRFLDHMDRRIRRYIRAKQKMVKLLEEQKQAIIHRAVTRGLDPNVRLKPSGVQWLGDVPEHWETRRIASFSPKITNGWVGPTREILEGSGVPYIQSLHIKSGSIRFIKKYFVAATWLERHDKIRLCRGDVVIVQTGDIGQVACVPPEFDGAGCHALIIIRTDPSVIGGPFLDLVLRSWYGYENLRRMQTGALHPHLNCTWVREIIVPTPPLREQESLLHELGARTATHDRATTCAEREVTLIRDLRIRLIADVVTGKLDVREAAANLPEEPDKPEPLDEAEGLVNSDEEVADDLHATPEEAEA